MAETLNLGNGNWATKKESLLAYNSENNNYKPLPFNFTRNSSATRVNKEGLIEVVSNNEPRIDFKDNTKGSLLLEPTRSNSLLQSNSLDQWSKSPSIEVIGSQVGVGGSNDAWLVTNTDGLSRYIQASSTLSGVQTLSFYAKANTTDWILINNGVAYCYLDVANGVQGVTYLFSDVKFELMDNSWYRITLTSDIAISFTRFYPSQSDGAISGNPNNSFYLQYAQLEQGSYATSYIPTSGSAVTRVAEQGINGGAGVPIFSNTSAVWFIDLERNGVDTDSSGSAIALRNSSFSQQIRLHFDQPATNIRFRDGLNGFATISTIIGMSAGVRKKIALRINGSALSTFANGSKIGSDYTAPSTFNIDEIDFATLGFKIHDMRFYNEILTDQELINLTTI